jgi:hypothetical protein
MATQQATANLPLENLDAKILFETGACGTFIKLLCSTS